MAQHDYTIANQGFPAFRSDLNDALAAIVSNNSGATEPTTMFAHQMWVDTAADPSVLKIRNADNDAWITIGSIDQTGDTFTLTSAVSATTLNTSGAVVFNDAGADVDFRVEGDTEPNLLFVDAGADAVGIGTDTPDKKLHVVGDDGVTTFSSYGARDFLVVENNQNTNIQIVSNSANSGNILFSDEAASGRGAITYDHSSDDMVFKSAATEAARFTSAGNLKFPDGQGIDFSASAGGGATSSILDDYEEGTWTPVLSDAISGGNTSPTAATSATYTKVGRIVTVQCAFINIDTTGMTGANNLHIQDFPFAPVSVSGTAYIPGAVVLTNTTFTGYIQSTIADNATWGRFPSISSGGGLSFVTVSELTSGSADLYLSLTYSAA